MNPDVPYIPLPRDFTVIEADGTVAFRAQCPDAPPVGEGQRVISVMAPPNSYYDAALGEFVRYPDAPGPWAVWDMPARRWADPRVLADLRAEKLAEINAAFTDAAASLNAGAPPAERLTWPVQQAEALAWAADPATPTPYLDGLAEARGIAPKAMREKALANVRAFLTASHSLIGTRQALKDALKSATTAQAVASISWPPQLSE